MMTTFKKNKRIKTDMGAELTIVSDEPLGSGGQGEVYRVSFKGKECALKWYTSEKIKDNEDNFKKNLNDNIDIGAPTDKFLWPLAVTESIDGSFGYVMNLIPPEYDSLSDILRTYKLKNDSNGKATRIRVGFSSLDAMVLAAMNIAHSFRELHRKGLSYQDMNDGGFFINTSTGDVLICDCDNVAPDNTNLGINGKPGYMAPEVVLREKRPDTDSDKFSLAVVLFKLLMNGDPLEGAKVLRSCVLTGSAELEHYGKNPVFVYDPKDTSNRPVNGVHNNVIRKWMLFPEYLRDTFTKAFTAGLKDPSKRPIDNEWFCILSKLRSDIVTCDCGAFQNFLSLSDSSGNKYTCPKCKRTFCVLDIDGVKTALTIGAVLHLNQIKANNEDYNSVCATVIENKKRPGVLGLKNSSDKPWKVDYGTQVMNIDVGRTATITENMTIDFGHKKKGTTRSE